jgi:hypothetical protein
MNISVIAAFIVINVFNYQSCYLFLFSGFPFTFSWSFFLFLLIPTVMNSIDSLNNAVQERLPPKLPPRASSSTFVAGPSAPALPDRAKSVDQLSLDATAAVIKKSNPSIDEHYAHLSKHVKEVRRRKAKNDLVAPKLSDFQNKEAGGDDTVSSTNWMGFIEAVR